MAYRQNDILLSQPTFYQIPRNVPGRTLTTDFLTVLMPDRFPASRYQVVVETLMKTDGPHPYWRSIGRLNSWGVKNDAVKLEIPHVHFSPYAKIAILPDSDSLPAFYGQLVRGGTYHIPKVPSNGSYQMTQFGKIQ